MPTPRDEKAPPIKPVPAPAWLMPLIFAILVGSFLYYEHKEKKELETKMQPYNDAVAQYLDRKEFSASPIPIKGKVVTINLKSKTVDPFRTWLGPNYVPSKPSEVQTAIVHDCNDVVVGTYTGGMKAIQQQCTIFLVDVESKTWYRWGEINGSLPPDEIRRKRGSSADERGSNGIDEFLIKHVR